MTPEERNELEVDAGEYVLGTLAASERRRFEARLATEPAARDAVTAWEARLHPLASGLAPVAPSRSTWPKIADRLGQAGATSGLSAPLWHRVQFWRPFAFMATAAALALAVVVGVVGPGTPERTDFVSVLNDAQAKPTLIVRADAAGHLAIRPLTALAPPTDRSLQLWLIPAAGPPRPLGLLEPGVATMLILPEAPRTMLAQASGLAVSLEPRGGSPTGLPTGPVLYQGAVHGLN